MIRSDWIRPRRCGIARASLDAFTEARRFLGVGITLDRLEDALLIEGVDQVDLTAPAANLAAAEIVAYHPGERDAESHGWQPDDYAAILR